VCGFVFPPLVFGWRLFLAGFLLGFLLSFGYLVGAVHLCYIGLWIAPATLWLPLLLGLVMLTEQLRKFDDDIVQGYAWGFGIGIIAYTLYHVTTTTPDRYTHCSIYGLGCTGLNCITFTLVMTVFISVGIFAFTYREEPIPW